jgi:multidrug transporter EmrE-like cation transporter
MVLDKRVYLIFIILLITIAECLGQVCLKTLFHNPDKYHLYFAAVVLYSLVCYLILLSYQYNSMGIVNLLWGGTSTLLVLLAGWLLFNEKHSRLDVLGICLVISGIFCIMLEDKP